MELIDRNIINSNLKIRELNNTTGELNHHSYTEVIQYINQAKTFLVNEKNCRPGDKILLAMSGWPQYLVWFIACAELGLSFVVSDHPNIENYKSVAKKLTLYGDISHLIGRPGSEVLNHYPTLIHKLINCDSFFDYFNQDAADFTWANPESIILYATSSGTTDTPKVMSYTHKFFYDLLERNAKLYDLKSHDKCLHTKGLHHGSVTGVYFLPTLKYCSNHYYAKSYEETTDNKTLKSPNWVELIQEEKINRCLLFYNMTDHFVQIADINKKQHDDLTVYVLSKIHKNQIDTIVGKFGYKIFSIFGCTETSGPLFLPEFSKETLTTYDLSNMGKPLDSFYKINLDQNQILTVTMPDNTIISTGDKFELINGDYFFSGRENLYRIRGETIYLNILIEVIESLLQAKHNDQFDVVFDKELEKIYIRSDIKLDLQHINSEILSILKKSNYSISNQIIGPRFKFFSGIKFDPELIRIYCRENG